MGRSETWIGLPFSGEHFIGEGIVDAGQQRGPVPEQRHRDGGQAQVMDEVRSPVHRVNNPGIGIGQRVVFLFLADERRSGAELLQPAQQELLDADIHVRHKIGMTFLCRDFQG